MAACLVVAFALVVPIGPGQAGTRAASVAENAPAALPGGGADASGQELAAHPTWENGVPYRAGEVMVELADGATAAQLNSGLARYDFVSSAPLSERDIALGWARVGLAAGADVKSALAKLESDSLIASVQPNFVYHLLDESASASGGQSETASAGGELADSQAATTTSQAASALVAATLAAQSSDDWHLDAIGARTAWATQTVDGKVSVAVIDSGCDVAHSDLRPNIVATYNALNGGRSVPDANGHGTHVAGIIAAAADNGTSVAGVSHDAGLVPVKVMVDDETDSATLLAAYEYVVRNAKRYNIRVVNLSLGAKQEGLDIYDAALLKAIDRAYFSGVLTVMAAGNSGRTAPYYCFPCDYSETGIGVINVGKDYDASASASNNGLPDFSSNYNKPHEMTKDLSAPGVDILSTYPGGGYAYESGTSMSTPMVSAVAALVFARNPSLAAGEAKSVLCSTAQDLVHRTSSAVRNRGFDDYTGYGLVRADLAVAGAYSAYLSGTDALRVGETARLSVPSAAGSGVWTWSSSNPSVASVNATTGLVRGVGHGEASISATNGTSTLKRTIVVYGVSMGSVKTLAIGQTATLPISTNPVAMWTCSSSNPAVASIGSTSGFVTAKKLGTTTITVRLTACPSVKATKQIKVVKRKNSMKVVGETVKLNAAKAKRGCAVSGVIVKKAPKGKLSYAKVAKGSSDRLSVKASSGRIVVKKGTKRGVYKIRVRAKTQGTSVYGACAKTVTVKVAVR